MRSVQGEESVKLFRLSTGSAGLLKDKKRCSMVNDERCVVIAEWGGCGSFPGGLWGEFEGDWLVLLDDVFRIVGAENGWINFRVHEEGKVALLLGKGVKGVCNSMIHSTLYPLFSGLLFS